MKISIFLDFWNFTLSFKNYDSTFRPDWFSIPKVLTAEASALLSDCALDLQDFNIFGSYSLSDTDAKLRNWISTFLPKIPGAHVCFLQRQQKISGPVCPQCHTEIKQCPLCKSSMLGTEENALIH